MGQKARTREYSINFLVVDLEALPNEQGNLPAPTRKNESFRTLADNSRGNRRGLATPQQRLRYNSELGEMAHLIEDRRLRVRDEYAVG